LFLYMMYGLNSNNTETRNYSGIICDEVSDN
jgi:hypothetical protein